MLGAQHLSHLSQRRDCPRIVKRPRSVKHREAGEMRWQDRQVRSGTTLVAQGDELTRSIHPDVGKQYFVKITLSASLVRSISPRSVMVFLLSLSIFSSPSKVCSTIVLSPSNNILRLCSSITTE